MEKILFKQSNGLISVIQTLLHWKQWLRDSMLTLNAVVQTNNAEHLGCPNSAVGKHQKTPQTHFGQS